MMATFVISNLDFGQGNDKFEFENIEFLKLKRGIEIEDQWRADYSATFKAIVNDELETQPIISGSELINKINDICLLLSLAQSRTVMCPEFTVRNATKGRPNYPIGLPLGSKMVDDKIIPTYLSTAASKLRQEQFPERSGFIPSIYYLLSCASAEFIDSKFLFAWIALETVVNSYAEQNNIDKIFTDKQEFKKYISPITEMLSTETNGYERKLLVKKKLSELNRPPIKYLIQKFKEQYDCAFLTDELIKQCHCIRRFVHKGKHVLSGQNVEFRLLTERLIRAVQLIMFRLLECLEYVSEIDKLIASIVSEESGLTNV